MWPTYSLALIVVASAGSGLWFVAAHGTTRKLAAIPGPETVRLSGNPKAIPDRDGTKEGLAIGARHSWLARSVAVAVSPANLSPANLNTAPARQTGQMPQRGEGHNTPTLLRQSSPDRSRPYSTRAQTAQGLPAGIVLRTASGRGAPQAALPAPVLATGSAVSPPSSYTEASTTGSRIATLWPAKTGLRNNVAVARVSGGLPGRAAGFSNAATYTWNGLQASPNWSVAGNWTGGALPSSGASLLFSATAGSKTATDDHVYSLNSITFDSSAPSFTLEFAASAGFGTATILGAGGLTQNSPNLQTLAQAPSTNGNLTAYPNQTWAIGSGGLLVSAPMALAGTVTITGSGTTTFAGSLATLNNTSGLILNSTGALTITGATAFNNTDAGITVNSGTLNFGSSTVSVDLTSSPNLKLVNTGGVVNFNNASNANKATITNTKFVNFLDTSSAGTGTVNSNAGGVYFKNGSSGGTATLNVASGGNLYFYNSASANQATITVSSGGTATFFDNSTAWLANITNGGVLSFDSVNSSGTASATAAFITNNNFLNFLNYASAGGASIVNNGIVYFKDHSSGGTLTNLINGNSASIDLTGMASGASIGIPTVSGGGTIVLGSTNLTLGGAPSTTPVFSGVISGTGSLTFAGSNNLTLTGVNTYSGNTIVSKGNLIFAVPGNSSATIGNSNLIVNNGGTATVGAINALYGSGTTIAKTATINSGGKLATADEIAAHIGNVTLNGGTLASGTPNSVSGSFALQSGYAISATADSSITATSLFLRSGSSINVSSGVTLTDSGTLVDVTDGGGAGQITKTGGGVLTLTNSNSLTGGVTINGGILSFAGPGSTGAIPSSSLVLNSGGTAVVSLINALYGAGTTIAPTITINAGGKLTTADGITTHIGTLNLTGGTLASGTPSATSGSFALQSGYGINATANSTISATGLFLRSGSFVNVGSGVTLTDTGTLVNVTDGGGNGQLTKNGTGDLALYGTNTYSGGTTVNAGRLLIDNNAALGTGTITFQGGQVRADNAPRTLSNPITINGTALVGQLTTFTGNVNLAVDATLTEVDANGPVTFTGVISGAHSLRVGAAGGGSVTLANSASTYSGGTTVTGGTVYANGVGALGTGNVANNSALVFINSDAETVNSSKITGTGSVAMSGTGSLTYNGYMQYTGQTIVNSGTLYMNAPSDSAPYWGQVISPNGAGLLINAGGTVVIQADRQIPINVALVLGDSSGSSIATLNVGSTVNLISNLTLGNGALVTGPGGTQSAGLGAADYHGGLVPSGNLPTITVGAGDNATIATTVGIGTYTVFDIGAGGSLNVSGAVGQWYAVGSIKKTGGGSLSLTGGFGTTIPDSVSGHPRPVYDYIGGIDVYGGSMLFGSSPNIGTLNLYDALVGSSAGAGSGIGYAYNVNAQSSASVTDLNISGTSSGFVTSTAGTYFGVDSQVKGSSPITISGPGTVVLTNPSNNWTGGTTISSGSTLQVSSLAPLSTGSIVDNGTLLLLLNNSVTLTNTISGSGRLVVYASDGGNANGTNATSNTVTIPSNVAATGVGFTLVAGNGGPSGAGGSGGSGGWSTLNLNSSTGSAHGALVLTAGSSTSGSNYGSTLTPQNGGSGGSVSLSIGGLSAGQSDTFTSFTASPTDGSDGASSYMSMDGGNGGDGGGVQLSLSSSNALMLPSPMSITAGNGGSAGITSEAQGGVGGAGGSMAIALSATHSLVLTGAMSLTSGNGGEGGQAISLIGGTAGGNGGSVTLNLAASQAVTATSLFATAGNGGSGADGFNPYDSAPGAGGAGGNITISAGQSGAFGGISGTIALQAGNGGTQGRLGDYSQSPGIGGAGGAVLLNLSSSQAFSGGTLLLTAGNGGSADSEDVFKDTSKGVGGGAGGAARITAGYGGASNTLTGGSITLTGGASAGANSLPDEFNGGLPDYLGGAAGVASLILNGDNSAAGDTATVTLIPQTGDAYIELNGFSLTLGGIDSASPTGTGSAMVKNSAASGISILTLGTDNSTHSFAGQIVDGGAGGKLAMVKTGTGTQILSGSNSYTGGTTLNQGTLKLGSSTALGSGSFTQNGGTLSLNGYNAAVSSLSGLSGTINNANASSTTLTVTQSGSTSYLGTLSNGSGGGTLRLSMTGTGDLALYGTNTYTGGTSISSGRLLIDNNSALGTGIITVTGGQIRADNAARTLGNALALNGSFTVGQLTTFTGPVTLGANATISEADPDGSGSGFATFSGTISGAYKLTTASVNSTGTLILTGANTYSGGTQIASGTLQIGNLSSLGSGAVTNNSNLVFGAGTPTGTFGNAISGTGKVIKSNTATLTLTGSNTYSGGTTLSAGTLIASGNALGSGAVSIASGATLSVGQAANATRNPLAGVQTLSVSSLTVASASGNLTPLLTFNLMPNGSSDSLTLTGTGTTLSFSGAGKFVAGFASETGSALTNTTYTLLSFSNPGSLDTSGFDTSNANNSFQAVGTGNLSKVNGTFQWTKNSGGNITGLQFTMVNSTVTPEPGTLLLVSVCLPIGAAVRFRRKKSRD